MADVEVKEKVSGQEAVKHSLQKLEKLSDQHALAHSEKEKRMKKLIDKVVAAADSITDKSPEMNAKVACWKGQAYGMLPTYTEKAEKFLTKAIKLEPSLVAAWNCLGSEYWKKKDLKAAGDCFRNALEQKKNKTSYRKLSMVVRNFGDQKTYRKRLENSIDLAKKAIAMDVKDSESWYILGNAYMTSFFSTFATSDLEGCLKSYEAATKGSGSKNPDLYFNRANVHKFYERYQKAIDDFENARKYDPKLPAQEQIDNIHRFVKKMSKIVTTKNGIKAKRLMKFCELIPKAAQVRDAKRAELKELKVGKNAKSYIIGVVIAPVTRVENVPVSFILMGQKMSMYVLSIYGVLATLSNEIKVGDIICVKNPVLTQIFLDKWKERKYPCVSVPNPQNLSVNSKMLPQKALGMPSVHREMFG